MIRYTVTSLQEVHRPLGIFKHLTFVTVLTLQRFNDSLKYLIGFWIPSSKLTRGSQPRIFFARPMSGWRTFGSSTGSGLYSITDFVPIMRMISSANFLIVIS